MSEQPNIKKYEYEANAPSAEQAAQNTEDLLPREPCLQALAALRHAKWFQVCVFFTPKFSLFFV